MAIPNACSFGCPVNLQYSNPNIDFLTYPGVKSGSFTTDAQGRYKFNARTASLLAPAMANYRGPAVTDIIFRGDFESLPDITLP